MGQSNACEGLALYRSQKNGQSIDKLPGTNNLYSGSEYPVCVNALLEYVLFGQLQQPAGPSSGNGFEVLPTRLEFQGGR